MRKLLIAIKHNWVIILALAFFILVLLIGFYLIIRALATFFTLEGFMQKNLFAQYGILAIVFIFVHLVSYPLYFAMHVYILQGGILGKLGKEKIFRAQANIKWNEVIGMESAKQEAWELVKLLKDRSLIKAIGGKIIKGTLLIGLPGCGKTYLAKAISTECGLPMLSVVGSEFVGMFVGVGAAQMKSLFKQARTLAEAEGGCIIFIDEIDAFARPRQQITGFGGAFDHNATVNTFLTEMDGLRQTENNIVVLAATNVPEDELDSAIMRAGRFDRKIYFNRPNLKERKELFQFYLSRVKVDNSVNAEVLAQKTLWFTPAEIDGMIREAGLIALREKRDRINFKDLSAAYDRVRYGTKSNIQLNEDDKKWVAYHEAGHAIVNYLIHPTDDVIKATIVPHKSALGFIDPRPREEIFIHDRDWHLAEIKVLLASYAAEQIKFGTTGSGVSQDFRMAMQIAHDMVWKWGMGKSGHLGDMSQLLNHRGTSFIAEKTKEKLDEDVQHILQSSLQEVTALLNDKIELLDFFAAELLKKSELEYDEIEGIFQNFGFKRLSKYSSKTTSAAPHA